MTPRADRHLRASYGIDAPAFLPIAGLVLAANLVVAVWTHARGPMIGAAVILVCIGFFLHTTRRGKFLAWRDVLDGLELRGDERILDVGCGRGAVLLAAARRLPTGRAVGIDIWSRRDQSGNAANAARRNSAAEGVEECVSLATADMMALPFRAASFDVILSSIAIHNISGLAGRLRAVEEAARVLSPGGRLVLADIRSTGDYARRLQSLGMVEVKQHGLGWRMWWGGPWAPTRLVTATKPPGGAGLP
ncbi:MAG TPA: class I SAM-dependent methyltransferase [Gemmatimonadales bacterium]|nr:class I SAM-dependent methyltransferase [Gemmatimonadales bacterium]